MTEQAEYIFFYTVGRSQLYRTKINGSFLFLESTRDVLSTRPFSTKLVDLSKIHETSGSQQGRNFMSSGEEFPLYS